MALLQFYLYLVACTSLGISMAADISHSDRLTVKHQMFMLHNMIVKNRGSAPEPSDPESFPEVMSAVPEPPPDGSISEDPIPEDSTIGQRQNVDLPERQTPIESVQVDPLHDDLNTNKLEVDLASRNEVPQDAGLCTDDIYKSLKTIKQHLRVLENAFTEKCLGCPVGYVNISNKCYKFSREHRNWVEARNQCVEEGGDLVSLQTHFEDVTITQYIQVNRANLGYPLRFHTAGNMLNTFTPRIWCWGTGQHCEPFTYTGWAPSEPNAYEGESEDCVELNIDYGGWNNIPCYLPYLFICEMELVIL